MKRLWTFICGMVVAVTLMQPAVALEAQHAKQTYGTAVVSEIAWVTGGGQEYTFKEAAAIAKQHPSMTEGLLTAAAATMQVDVVGFAVENTKDSLRLVVGLKPDPTRKSDQSVLSIAVSSDCPVNSRFTPTISPAFADHISDTQFEAVLVAVTRIRHADNKRLAGASYRTRRLPTADYRLPDEIILNLKP